MDTRGRPTLDPEAFQQAKLEAGRAAAQTKLVGKQILRVIERACVEASRRIGDENFRGWVEEQNLGVNGVALFKRKLVSLAQAEFQTRLCRGGLVFEAKVTLEGITAAAIQLLGEGWDTPR